LKLTDSVTSHLLPAAPHGALAERYLELVRAGRRGEASDLILEAVRGGVHVKEIYLHVFQPAQWEVGRLWQTGQLSVAQEHFCTAATQWIMSQLYPWVFSGVRDRVRFAMNGDVQVYSEPGQGTTVRVYLPRALPAADAPPAALWADEPPHSPAARVLLVDDEPVLLRMTEKILRRLGHDVTSAPKGAVALDALTSSGFADTPKVGRSARRKACRFSRSRTHVRS
jgi:hypothetical protein